MPDLLAQLRTIDEDTITKALNRAYIELPITDKSQAVELIQRVLDVVTGEPDDGYFRVPRMGE